MKIVTTHVYPPIPERCFDWAAVDDDTYDGAPDAAHQIVGQGATEAAAILDFKEQANLCLKDGCVAEAVEECPTPWEFCATHAEEANRDAAAARADLLHDMAKDGE